jgi:xylulokinase
MHASDRNRLLAIDIGTAGIKVGLFDPNGALRAQAATPCGIDSPHPSWAEQSADMWWDSISDSIRSFGPSALEGVHGVCVVGQNPTLVCLDREGRTVRPAMGWADRRAMQQAATLSEQTGLKVDPSFNLAKAMWLRDEEPRTFARVATCLQSFDLINLRLTGELATVSAVPPWNPWDPRLIAAAGLEEDLFPERRCKLGEHIGDVSADRAGKTGLPAGVPVFAGLVDGLAAWIGTGTVCPGDMFAGGGTSAGVNLCWPEPLTDRDQRIGALPHPLGRRWMIGGPMSTGGRFLDWLARDVCRETIPRLCDEAAVVAPGADGLVALPYLMGERVPLFDAQARGVFFGLSSHHSRGHLARAALEAVAFALRDVAEIIEQAGGRITAVRTGGGGAASATWNQIKADVMGKPLHVPTVRDSSLLGAAVIAAAGAGMYADADSATRAMVHIEQTFEPRRETQPIYSELFALYRRLYASLRSDFASLAAIRDCA